MTENCSEILNRYNLTMDDAARLLHIGRSTIIRWRKKKYGPQPIHFGKMWRYSEEDILGWLKSLAGKEKQWKLP